MAHYLAPSGPPSYPAINDINSDDVSLPTSKRFTAYNFALTVSNRPSNSFDDVISTPNTQRFEFHPQNDGLGRSHQQTQLFTRAGHPVRPAVPSPMEYRAPVLTSRHTQSQEMVAFTPHDTYRYPQSPPPASDDSEPPPMEIARSPPVNTALAQWYVEQVVDLLLQPGQFREPVGGASELWGAAGVERASWDRLAQDDSDSFDLWYRASSMNRLKSLRNVRVEPYDPYVLACGHGEIVNANLVAYFDEVIARMAIPTSSVVAALWYLKGIGLHEGDGPTGFRLRRLLKQVWGTSPFAIEKRVAVLGLMLAGKWLDDNSYLVQSWGEITDISIPELVKMDRIVLEDFHFALSIPVSSWTEHVSQLFTQLVARNCADDYVGSMIITFFDEMVAEARASEKQYHDTISASKQRRPSVVHAADQAIDRAWGSFAKSYQVDIESFQHRYGYDDGFYQDRITEMRADDSAERAVSSLVDDMEEEFLEYDGAQRWIPPVSTFSRSESNGSVNSIDFTQAVNQWRMSAAHPQEVDATLQSRLASPRRQSHSSQEPSRFDSAFWPIPTRQQHDAYLFKTQDSFKPSSHGANHPYPRSDITNSPVFHHETPQHNDPFWLEPGIFVESRKHAAPPSTFPSVPYTSNHDGSFMSMNRHLSGLIR